MKSDTWHQVRDWAGIGLEAILDGLLPRHCLMCGLPSGGANLCPPCQADLPRPGHCCRSCGLPLLGAGDPWSREQGSETPLCASCLKQPPPWDRVTTALDYRFPVDALVQRFKFNRSLACGDVLARELARAVGLAVNAARHPCAIVPVPLHRSRHVSRTFNQSDLLARFVGKQMNIPVNNVLLSRVRKTHAQSGLGAKSRQKNTRGAFHCHFQRAKGIRHVALLDDVMTTGATLSACTQELKRAGIEEISIWVAARAPPP